MPWPKGYITPTTPMTAGKSVPAAETGIRPSVELKANAIDLDQAINGTHKREKHWSLSPPTAEWNDLWPQFPGQAPLINDGAV